MVDARERGADRGGRADDARVLQRLALRAARALALSRGGIRMGSPHRVAHRGARRIDAELSVGERARSI